MGGQGHAEHALRLVGDVVERLHHLDAAGLAAAAGMDLGLDHPDRAAELAGDGNGFIGREREAAARKRSEERRVGKECVSQCRSRGSPCHKTKKSKHKNSNTIHTSIEYKMNTIP